MLTDKSVNELLDAFSSPAPTPGGGSAAALSGALGASLLAMVAGLPKTKNGTPEDRAALDDARAELIALRDTLVGLIDRDAAAYDLVVAAYRKPRATDADQAARAAAIQDALRAATNAPLETMRACSEVLAVARTVAEHGNASAASDVAVGAQLLLTGIHGAWLNMGINLQSLTDPQVADALAEEALTVRKGNASSLWHTYEAGGVLELMKRTVERLGPISMHGSETMKEPSPDQFVVPVVELLARLGTPEARQAIAALAQSTNEETAGRARDALTRFKPRA